MSSTDQTHKRYLQDADGTVYWPITAWDAVVGKPTDLIDQAALVAAIAKIPQPDLSTYLTQSALNGYVVKGELPDFTKFALKTDLPTFDPNTVYTKDEVNAAIVKVKADIKAEFDAGEMADALAELKKLQDALSGENSQIAELLVQLTHKANVGDSYLKAEEDARFVNKAYVDTAINGRLPQIESKLAEQLLIASMSVTPDFTTGHMAYNVSPVTDASTTGAVVNTYVNSIRMTISDKGHLMTEVVS